MKQKHSGMSPSGSPTSGTAPREQTSDALKIARVTRPGFASVNTWLIEDKTGIVVIDAQRVLSAAQDVVAAIRASGKKPYAVLITHPHPDHFGGLAAILDAFPGTPVYASPETQKVIETDSNGFQAATRKVVPEDSPEVFPAPDRTFNDGDVLRFGTIELTVDEIGAGESEAMSMFHVPAVNALITGDVIANEMTGFVLEGRSAEWIAQINLILDKYHDSAPGLYPGHGADGAFETLLKGQRRWLTDLRDMTAARLENGALSDESVASIQAEFEAKYQNYPIVAEIPRLTALNIRAVAEELSNLN